MSFFSRFKKIFLIIGFLALVVVMGYLLWKLFFQPAGQTPTATTTPLGGSGFPSAGPGTGTGEDTGGPGNLPGGQDFIPSGSDLIGEPSATALGGLTKTTALSPGSTLGSTLGGDGRIQYYNPEDGRFYRLDADGNLNPLSDKVFHEVKDVTWAPDKNQAILEYPDGSKILYNFQTKKQVTLPSHWKDFSFSPASDQIVSKSIGLDPDNRWLMVSNEDGSQAKALEAIGENADKVYPAWSPGKQIVAMYTKGVDFDRQEIFFVGLNGENFKSTVVEGRGLEYEWSTTGDRLLYSVYHTRDDLKPRLWIVDAASDTISQNRRSFDLQTWASKCTFSSNTEIYCAVPENLEKGAGLFPELADRTKDDLYKIDLKTGTKKLIAVPDGTYNISQIMVPGNQNYLYFTDKATGMIYKINLK
jgi:hypothetical protein